MRQTIIGWARGGVHALRRLRAATLFRLNRAIGGESRFLNLGGGPWFAAMGWDNLEGVASPLNPRPFRFAPDCVFPFADCRFVLVYTSHMLEHLDPASLTRVLAEAWRVLRPGGHLVVKVPDYETLLRKWREGDAAFFSDRYWNFSGVTWTWPVKQVADTLANRASYIICGYWNRAYGEHFERSRERLAGAYNGPVAMADASLRALLGSGDPAQIAAALRAAAKAEDPEAVFNHQTAWTRAQFARMLAGAGFTVETDNDDRAVMRRFRAVPRMREMQNVSAYYAGRK